MGKPSLAAKFAPRDTRFNLSHSQDVAVYAIAFNREIGVDVKTKRPRFASEQIAEHFFLAPGSRGAAIAGTRQQVDAFFNRWTRKEAYIKARCEGFAIELASFDVSLKPGERAAILRAADRARWSIVFAPRCRAHHRDRDRGQCGSNRSAALALKRNKFVRYAMCAVWLVPSQAASGLSA